MPKPTDLRILATEFRTVAYQYRAPIKFGGRVVTDVELCEVAVDVETRAGLRGRGQGAMPLGNVWAWPAGSVTPAQSLAAIARLAERLTRAASECRDYGHPLDLTRRLARDHDAAAHAVVEELGLAEPFPALAVLLAASPLEAALHDALGQTLGVNSYNLLGPEYCAHDLAHYLTPEFAGEFLDRYTLRSPRPTMPLYHLVGALDPLTAADVTQPIGDGLPETLGDWILADGLTHLKIKLNGDDLEWDVERVVRVDRAAAAAQAQRGRAAWHYSLDFNERCAHVDYVLEFLRRVGAQAPAALARVQYIEQPTHRDLRAHPDNKMHRAAAIKPVVIDESLVDLDSLQLAREQGYSGVALKACKGQTEALLMGAAAQKYGLFLCVQDLTCIGRSFLHSASLAARLPTIAAIEGNGRQYCPAGNAAWVERFPSMFRITDGVVGTHALTGPGLGY